MFTIDNIKELDYFELFSKNKNEYELLSKNTLHCWKLEFNQGFYDLYHKHNFFDEYHYQSSYGSLFDTILDIVGHDVYLLRGRKPLNPYTNTCLTTLLEKYSNHCACN